MRICKTEHMLGSSKERAIVIKLALQLSDFLLVFPLILTVHPPLPWFIWDSIWTAEEGRIWLNTLETHLHHFSGFSTLGNFFNLSWNISFFMYKTNFNKFYFMSCIQCSEVCSILCVGLRRGSLLYFALFSSHIVVEEKSNNRCIE